LVCVEKPKLYVSYFAAGFDAVVNKTPDQENNAVALYTDVLTYKNPNELFPAAIYLTDSGLFTFNYSSLSSNVPMGRYEITNEKLILNADNGDVYVFSKVDGGYTFDAEASAKLPEYKISGDSNETYSPVPDGAVFYSNENSNVSPEEMLQISRKLAISERTASYFTGYARDVYGNESIEIDGVRYDVFTVCDSMDELLAITLELFDNELANTLINTQVDGHPLFVEQNGRLYRFGGYVALESISDASATVYGVTKGSDGVYTVYVKIQSDGDVVSGYEYRCIKVEDDYKFIGEFKLPIEVLSDMNR